MMTLLCPIHILDDLTKNPTATGKHQSNMTSGMTGSKVNDFLTHMLARFSGSNRKASGYQSPTQWRFQHVHLGGVPPKNVGCMPAKQQHNT